jgi:hypothetical protein
VSESSTTGLKNAPKLLKMLAFPAALQQNYEGTRSADAIDRNF